MSVAFTKENDRDGTEADLPERPISTHTNLVTPKGLAELEAALERAREAYSAAHAAGEDQTSLALARAGRDLRYYSARRASAQLVEPQGQHEIVAFGSRVTFDRADGRRQTFQIVGEDEADPAKGTISYVSPIAAALVGKGVGDTATVAGGEVEIIAID
jgi:transcription elongation GreA/GreB family factor